MLTPDLTPIYGFIAIIVTLLSFGLIFSEGRAQRGILLIVIFGAASVGVWCHHTSMADRITQANEQVAALAKCQGTGEICQWETH